MNIDQPLFEEHSYAGYQWACHYATCQLADSLGLDLDNPADRNAIVETLSIWVQKLRFHTPRPQWTPTDDNPF